MGGRPAVARTRVPGPGVDRILLGVTAAILLIRDPAVWSSTSTNDTLTHGDPTAYLRKQLVNVVIGLAWPPPWSSPTAAWVRILAPLVYAGAVVGLLLVLVMGSTINGSRSWLLIGGLSIQPAEFAKLAVVVGMALIVAERTESAPPSGRRRRGRRCWWSPGCPRP